MTTGLKAPGSPGFAAAFTESDSIGAADCTSAVSERDCYQAGQAREAAGTDAAPEAGRQQIRDIYAASGFAGELIGRVADTITASRQGCLSTMMEDELHRQPARTLGIFRSAIVITVATLTGHLKPCCRSHGCPAPQR